MKSLWTVFLFAGFLATTAEAKTNSPALGEETAAQFTAEIIENILSKVVKSGCHFQYTGSTSPEMTEITTLNLNCAFLLKDDVRIDLMERKSKSSNSKLQEQFKTELTLLTKDLWAVLDAQKAKTTGQLTLRFYSNSQILQKKKPLKETSLVVRVGTNVNADISTLNLSAVDISATVDPTNPKKYSINGRCTSYQEFLDINEGGLVKLPAKCFVNGTFEAGVGAHLKHGYVDQTPGQAKP